MPVGHGHGAASSWPGELPREPHNAPLHLFSASPELVGFGGGAYRQRSEHDEPAGRSCSRDFRGRALPCRSRWRTSTASTSGSTSRSSRRRSSGRPSGHSVRRSGRKCFQGLPPNEWQAMLQGLPPKERQAMLQGLPPKVRQELLQALPPEERLAGLTPGADPGIPGPAVQKPSRPAQAAAEEVAGRPGGRRNGRVRTSGAELAAPDPYPPD